MPVCERKRQCSACVCVYVCMCVCMYVYVCMCVCLRKREKRVAWAPYLLFRLQIWQCHKRAALQNLSPHLQKKKKSMLASCFMSWARNGCIYERIWTDWNTWSIHTPIFAQHNSHSHTYIHTYILIYINHTSMHPYDICLHICQANTSYHFSQFSYELDSASHRSAQLVDLLAAAHLKRWESLYSII